MTTVWGEYIVLAEDLAAHGSEAWQRSAVSRAYYGAFNSARRWVEANLGSVDNGSAHRRVWRTFIANAERGQDARAAWMTVGRLGDELRRLRNQADYVDDMADLDRHVPAAVASAEAIIALLAELEPAA